MTATRQLGLPLIRLLEELLSIERDGCLVDPDHAPTNVSRLQRHRVLEVQNSAFRRGGLPPASAGPLRLPVDEETAGTVLLNHQAVALVYIDPAANRRG